MEGSERATEFIQRANEAQILIFSMYMDEFRLGHGCCGRGEKQRRTARATGGWAEATGSHGGDDGGAG